jgi:hypothetical protein
MATRAFARRGGFEYLGKPLDFGQLFELAGARNDEKLVRLGYVQEWTGKPKDAAKCRVCGAEFISESYRDRHGNARHSERALTPDQEDAQAERDDRFAAEVAPIAWEKTAAAQGGSPAAGR